jgi:hypothetical protein
MMTNSKKRISFAVALAGIAAIASGAEPPASPDVAATYDPAGLTSLKVGGLEQLTDGAVRVTKTRVADTYRNPYELADPYVKDERTFTNASVELRSTAFDPVQKRLTHTFDWGSVAVSYVAAAGKLDASIEVQNRSTQVIEQIEFDLLAMVVPKGAKLWKGNDNLGAPVFSDIDPEVIRFQRASFPAERDDTLKELGFTDAEEPGAAEIRLLCPACFPKAVSEHLMATKEMAVPLDLVTEGVCARCKAETHLPRDPVVVAGTPQANRPLSLVWEPRQPGTATLKVTAGNEQAPEPYDGVWNVRPIKPGATEIIEVALRFGPAGFSAQTIAPDLCEAFVKANPFRLHWPDRRPIAMAQLAAERGPEQNPRGWWGLRENKADIRTPEGKAVFDKWIMDYADRLIAVADKAGSQGVIIWDLEGKQYPGDVYYGDPRIMKYVAPEMEAQADAFFKKLRDAGLRVGVCLRPTQIYPKAVPDAEIEKYRQPYPTGLAELPYTELWDKFNLASYGQEFSAYDELGQKTKTPLPDLKRSPVERLDAKIKYCQERWGVTLFYVDTDSFLRTRAKEKPNAQGGFDEPGRWSQLMMSAEQWTELQRRHPDCLLMPEHEYTQYWASTAPYRQPPYDGATPADVSALYPEAFSAIAMNGDAETHIKKAVGAYTAAIRRGDLLMHHGWYGPSDVVPTIYRAAAESAPVRVTLKADGSFTLGDKAIADLPALKQAVEAQVKGKPFADRRVFVQYAPTASRAARAALIGALEKADAVIVWSQPLSAIK